MSPLSWPVATGALLLGSPALWAALVDGTLSLDSALLRVALCGLATWAALSAAVSLSGDALRSAREGIAEQRPERRPPG